MPLVTIDGHVYVPRANNKYAGQSKTLGEAFKECREKSGMSLSKAADRAGISKSHLWAIEKNETEPSLWIAYSVVRLYGVDLNALAGLPRA
jgi:DNA-binding XRE family transcriptional regulator